MIKNITINLPKLLNGEQKGKVYKYLFYERENEVVIENINFIDMGSFTALSVFVLFDSVGYMNRFEEYVEQDILEFLNKMYE